MGLSRKIYVVFGMLLLMLGVIAAVGLVNTSSMKSALNSTFEEAFFEAHYFTELKGELEHSQRLLLNILIESDSADVKGLLDELEVATRQVDSKLAYMLLDDNDFDPETRLAIVEFKETWEEFKVLRDGLLGPAIDLKRSANLGVADFTSNSPLRESFQSLILLATDLVEHEKLEAATSTRLVTAKYDHKVRVYLLIVVIGGLFMVVMLVYLFRSVIGRIKTLGSAMQQVEGGKLDFKISVEGTDEIADLMQSFNRMVRQVYEGHVNQEQVKMILKWNSQEMEAKNIRLDKYNKELLDANKSIERTREQMVQSEKMASVGQLAAGIAHEINNPIGFISGNLSTLGGYLKDISELVGMFREMEELLAGRDYEGASLLAKKIDDFMKVSDIDSVLEGLDSLVRESKEGADRVVSIVRGLKEFSHKGEAEMATTDINHCLENVIKIVWNEIKYKAEIKKDLADLPNVMCRPQQVAQVFMNIIVNAAQAIEDKGNISIRTYAGDADVFVEIGDDGKGMDEDAVRLIFDPFFTTKEAVAGAGLGLSVAYGIISDHSGAIDVRSKPGEGTVFTVRLPKAGAACNEEGGYMDKTA
ncbi:hypothetical protein MNBD_DELTA02-966 [hydrothermal vent metagenome]|uniref:histidine kinase n=1 Tax=hydrothermal vent metagenome TaxID=652676 RepID=A0A3B0VXG4_9ZZZZ